MDMSFIAPAVVVIADIVVVVIGEEDNEDVADNVQLVQQKK